MSPIGPTMGQKAQHYGLIIASFAKKLYPTNEKHHCDYGVEKIYFLSNGIPYRTKIRRTKVSKFWLGVENFVRQNILSDEILSNKVVSFGGKIFKTTSPL